MESSPAIEAARHFLSVVWDQQAPGDASLARALDRLLAAYHDTPDAAPSATDLKAPRQDYEALFGEVAARFPDYGYYAVTDPLGSLESPEALIGDAIDDLADIILDMREMLWLSENAGIGDAHWSFRFLFFHWGTHARELALYLHARQFR